MNNIFHAIYNSQIKRYTRYNFRCFDCLSNTVAIIQSYRSRKIDPPIRYTAHFNLIRGLKNDKYSGHDMKLLLVLGF